MFRSFANAIQSLVFLPQCLSCGDNLENSADQGLCGECVSNLRLLKTTGWFPHLSKQWFDRAYSAAVYEGAMLDWVHQFKFGKKMFWAHPLSALLLNVPLDWKEYQAIVYVPLHWRRQIVRGFNSAQLLADRLSRFHRIPLIHPLRRVRSATPQTRLSREERLQNVRGVFGLRRRPLSLRDQKLLLVDDVLTTGATANECAKILKNAGAATVDVLTLARTL